jgi:APA family basic amino acid/polyamine antiporter
LDRDPKLIRAVGRWDLAALAINGVIGSSIFALPATVALLTGAWSVLACLLCAGIVLFIVLCFAELSSIFSETGGPYLYAREAFGDATGLVAGWMMWLARVTAYAANSNLLVSFAAYFAPVFKETVPRAIFLTGTSAFLTWVNIRGVRHAAYVGDVLAAAKMVPMLAFVVIGMFFVDSSLIDFGSKPVSFDFGQAVLLYIFAFTGFEFAAIPAGEAVAPQKHLPQAMLLALVLAAILYTGIQLVCLGTLPGLERSQTAMADAGARFLGPVGGQIIALTALASISGNLSAIALVSPRLTYALGRDGVLPQGLASVHSRYHTPFVSILLFGALTLILALSGTFVGMVRVSSIARIITYILACLALPVLRRKYPADPERFRVKGGYVVPALAVGLCLWLLCQSQWKDALAAVAALAAGFALYGATALWKGHTGPGRL